MIVVIPDDILQAAEISEAELKLELAILLYTKKKLSMGKARRLAGMHLIEFQRVLAYNKFIIQLSFLKLCMMKWRV